MTNPQDAIAKILEQQEAKRQAIMSKVQPVEDRPVCSCGVEMVRHHFSNNFWCPCCEITAANLAQQRGHNAQNRATQTAQQREAKQALIIAKNDTHPIYGYIRRLTAHLMADLDLPCGRIVFRNRQASEHRTVEKADHSIEHRFTYGFHGIDFWVEEGFTDLASWNWLWSGHKNLVGKKAAWALVLHEVGHAIQTAQNGRHRGKMHTRVWSAAVQRLQAQYPFEQVRTI